jgi:RNA polymerase sigma factor (TIGR02999 family)
MSNNPAELTAVFQCLGEGEPQAMERLVPLVYQQLRRLAVRHLRLERADHTLQPTALVNEFMLKFMSWSKSNAINDRQHFFRLAANIMRGVLIDHARARASDFRRTSLVMRSKSQCDSDMSEIEMLIDVDDCLEELEKVDSGAADVVKLRLYMGLSVTEAAQALGISRSTAYESWFFARAWFADRMAVDLSPCGTSASA